MMILEPPGFRKATLSTYFLGFAFERGSYVMLQPFGNAVETGIKKTISFILA